MIDAMIALAAGGLVAAAGAEYAAPVLLKRAQIARLRAFARENRLVALTYDDGPGAELTPVLRSALGRAGVRATFFPTGMSAARQAGLLDALVSDGHEIGCHSHNHRHAWKTSPWRTLSDMSTGFDVLQRWMPQNGLFRPPYGKTTSTTWFAAARRGRPFAWWTIDSGDTREVLPDPRLAIDRLAAEGGGILLMHDFDRQSADRVLRHEFVHQVTRDAVTMARDGAFTVLTLGELLRRMRVNA